MVHVNCMCVTVTVTVTVNYHLYGARELYVRDRDRNYMIICMVHVNHDRMLSRVRSACVHALYVSSGFVYLAC
jgi:hypothetical protein